MGESRTKNSIRNIIFSISAYAIQIILGFLVRRYFIYYFNEEFLGLNSLFSNILSVLSLAELGVGGAIVFSMYKPMAEGDKEKVNALLNFYKKCYFIIGFVVLGLGLCVIPFMDYFKAKAPQVEINLYIVYLLFLGNSVLSYFCAHRRALLYTDQRQDIESKINIVINILQTVLQLVVILFIKNFYIYLLCASFATLINNTFVYIVTSKKYKEFIKNSSSNIDTSTKKEIKKNVSAMLFHKIGGVVVFSTDSILIYLLIGASQLGKYSNYSLIISYVGLIMSLYINAIKGSIGNSIVSRDNNENYKLFRKLNFAHLFIVAFCSICIFVLSDPFIDVILTKNKESSLLLNFETLLALSVSFYFTQSRYMLNTFKECAGLFYQDRFKPIGEVIINLVASIVLAKWFGIVGIVLGTIISTISLPLWIEPHILNKYYLKKNTSGYLLKYLTCFTITLACGFVTYFICGFIPNIGLLTLALKFITCIIISLVTLFIGFCVMPEFRECISWGKDIIKNFKSKKKLKVVADVVTVPVDVDKDGVVDVETIAIFDKETKEQIDVVDELSVQENNTDKNIADNELKLKENNNDQQ